MMANQFLALGLFIMLLSFFIVLNSMSNFEITKSQTVIQSVTEAFLDNTPGEPEYLSQNIAPKARSTAQGSAMDQINALFQSTIPGAKMRKNRLGNVMSLQVSRADFESALRGTQSSDDPLFNGQQFTKILVSLISSRSAIPYEMDMLINIEDNPSRFVQDNPAQSARLIKQAASYASRLEQEGLQRKYMTSGLAKGKPDTVTLTFRHYNPIALELE